MKRIIRITLCLASTCMIMGNLHNNPWAICASVLFLSANVLALGYNEYKGK